MTDKLDRMLRALPQERMPDELVASIRRAVRRRHRRRQAARRTCGLLLAALGVWLLWPAILWLSSEELYASGAPWLMGGLEYLSYESTELLTGLWNQLVAAPAALGSALAVSVLLGALLVCGSIFLEIDPSSWRSLSGRKEPGGGPAILSQGLHL